MKLCDEKLLLVRELMQKGDINDALDVLYQVEKTTRLGDDAISTGRILVAIARTCYELKDFSRLNDIILTFVKKKSQSKLAVTQMIRECMTYIDDLVEEKEKVALINTLRTATEGKIFVETERARLTKQLAVIQENDDDIAGAAKIMMEIQIETFGTINVTEKLDFILEQMRLLIDTNDSEKAHIYEKKVNRKLFADPKLDYLKIRFYGLMIKLEKDTNYLNTSRYYQCVLDTDSVLEVPERRKKLLTCAILYCILSPYSSEQYDMMMRLNQHKYLREIVDYKDLISLFLANEIIDWNRMRLDYKKHFLLLPMFSTKSSSGIKCWKELRSRIIENNIRVVSMYYSCITMTRLSELLQINQNETEKHLIQLITDGFLKQKAKIDRLSGIINFKMPLNTNDRLNLWANNCGSLMNLLERTTNLINNEQSRRRNIPEVMMCKS